LDVDFASRMSAVQTGLAPSPGWQRRRNETQQAASPFESRSNPETRQAASVRNDFPVGFPCVLKPLALSGSRGVIRADTPAEAAAAFERIRAMLLSPDVQVLREEALGFIQAEEYVEGEEVAVEAIMQAGEL